MEIRSASQTSSLASKSVTALKWVYLGRIILLSLKLAIGIVLVRLLDPEPFGLVAIALLVQGLGNLFAEGGLISALIQSQAISEHDIRSVFSAQLLIGTLISSIVISIAPLLAGFLTSPTPRW